VNYLLRVTHNINETRHSVSLYSSSSGSHLGQPSTSEQDTEHVPSIFLQSNISLKTCKCGAYHPIHGAWCAYASQDTAPPSLYFPISAAYNCRWQVKVVWIHDADVWKAGNVQPCVTKSCFMVTSVCRADMILMWHKLRAENRNVVGIIAVHLAINVTHI
jgi:hypothetical protein